MEKRRGLVRFLLFSALSALCILSAASGGMAATSWFATVKGSGNLDDRGSAIAVDSIGNVYVAGGATGTSGKLDFLTMKYNASGGRLWSVGFDGTAFLDDEVVGIAVDGYGNAHVTGPSYSVGSGLDYVTIKYNSSGQLVWKAVYNGPANANDVPVAIGVDTSGNVYVVGNSYASSGKSDVLTVKYNASGQKMWESRFNGSPSGADYATAMILDGSGCPIVVGSSEAWNGKSDFLVLKYNPSNGYRIWTQINNTSANGNDVWYAVAVDAAGDVYATGTCETANSTTDMFTARYRGADGVRLRVKQYDSPAHRNDAGWAIVVNPAGEVYVAGYCELTSGKKTIAIQKYGLSQETIWNRDYQGNLGGSSYAKMLSLDQLGNVFVMGSSAGLGGYSDIVALKYNPAGSLLWAKRFDGQGNRNDYYRGGITDTLGNLFLTGRAQANNLYSDFVTIKSSTANNLRSNFFNTEPNVDAILKGTAYDVNDPSWVTYVGPAKKQNRDCFAYKIFSALHMLGYVTQRGFNQGDRTPQVTVLRQFKRESGLPDNSLLDAQTLRALDTALLAREKSIAAAAASFPLADHMQPIHKYDISREALAMLYQLPMSVLPPYLQMGKTEMASCIRGQCMGQIQDANGNNWSPKYVDPTLDYRFVGSYFDPRVLNSILTSATLNIDTVLHEYAHYLDNFSHSAPDPQLPHYKILNTVGFHNISFDMSTFNPSGNACANRRTNNIKDFISKYGFESNYPCVEKYPGKYTFQEEFAESFQMYVTSGKQFRAAAQQNATILRKYEWLKYNVFQGIEYDTDFNQGVHSGCNDVPGYETSQPAYMNCNENYVWDGLLKKLP